MKYYITGLVRCLADVVVEAESYDEAAKLAAEQCLTGNPIQKPTFEVLNIATKLPDEEFDKVYDEVDDVEERIEENEALCDESEEDEEDYEAYEEFLKAAKEAAKEVVKEDEEAGCCKFNKNKKCCGKCKVKKLDDDEFMHIYPLIALIERMQGGDEWDFV